MQCVALASLLQVRVCCRVLQRDALPGAAMRAVHTLHYTATHCNILQLGKVAIIHCTHLKHTATHYSTLHHTAAHGNSRKW